VAAEVSENGRQVGLIADDATRAAVAKAAGLLALPRLEARFDLTRHGAEGLHVTGRVSATVGQSCVVTMEPVENLVDEPIDLLFLPPEEPKPGRKPAADIDALEAVTEDPPETLHDGAADLGALAVEYLLLGIDPYPRKPGAKFDAPPADDPASHPFAALAALKKGSAPKNG
jgi:hypothetical protein